MTRAEARAMVDAMVRLREDATDKQGSAAVELYPTLKGQGALVKAGARINWNGALKRAAADLWDTPENSPEAAPELWEDIAYREGFRIIPATITAGLAFDLGERGWWGGQLYESLLTANVNTPEAYPDGWTRIGGE
ncbi:MAG: hypothetical protein ACOX81_02190 [Candidatus Heteroscillospira sp.]|jgi:hypothetical protein